MCMLYSFLKILLHILGKGVIPCGFFRIMRTVSVVLILSIRFVCGSMWTLNGISFVVICAVLFVVLIVVIYGCLVLFLRVVLVRLCRLLIGLSGIVFVFLIILLLGVGIIGAMFFSVLIYFFILVLFGLGLILYYLLCLWLAPGCYFVSFVVIEEVLYLIFVCCVMILFWPPYRFWCL